MNNHNHAGSRGWRKLGRTREKEGETVWWAGSVMGRNRREVQRVSRMNRNMGWEKKGTSKHFFKRFLDIETLRFFC